MKKHFAPLLLGVVAALSLAGSAAAQRDLSQSITNAVTSAITTSVTRTVTMATNFAVNAAIENATNASLGWSDYSDSDNDQCPDGSHTQFGDYLKTYSAVEQHTLPVTIGTVYVHGVRNGGVSVRGWDKNEVEVTACKYAGAENDSAGQQQLAAIQVQISGGDITANGPDQRDDSRWTIHFIVHAPKSVAFKLEAHNGPMSIRDTASDVEAHTVNGPLSIKLASGNVTATTQNGPLSISDCSGKINASAQNGPLTVSLNDKAWRGEGLDASTHNGPLTVRVPEGYQTGVDVEASGHGPFSCSLKDCDSVQASKPWDRDKKVHLGSGNTLVRVSTVNGPVHIGSSME